MRQLILWCSLLLLASQLTVAGAVAGEPVTRPAQGGFKFAGTILNARTERPIVADVVIYAADGTQLGKLEVSWTGTFVMEAPASGQYRFAVSALGYEPQEVTVSTQAGAPVALTVRLVPLKVGTRVILSSIRFAQSKFELLPESFQELNRLVDLLTANTQMEIQLNGHTDNQGDTTKNVILSENRVQAVQDYLVSKGIAASRLHGRGFGGRHPIASNKQEPTRKLNRRVEFEILKD